MDFTDFMDIPDFMDIFLDFMDITDSGGGDDQNSFSWNSLTRKSKLL